MITPIRFRLALSRREFTQLALLFPWFPSAPQAPANGRRVQTSSDGEPHFVDPPGEIPSSLQRRVEELGAALAAGTTSTNDVLVDPASNELRPYPLFRETIAKHAATGRAVLVPRDEPGTRLSVALRVVDRDGAPCRGARVYAYQTCAKGWYAAEAPHVAGNSGDFRFARLFACALTDAEGRVELLTIRPAGYPRSELPSHIHLLLEKGADERGTEVRFEDCPRMTPAAREESLRAGFAVVPVELLPGGGARCAVEFGLPAG